MASLELPDLLYAVERRGDKFKYKIGKSLAVSGTFSDYGQRKTMTNFKNDEGDEDDGEASK